jgi:hypothetical protein
MGELTLAINSAIKYYSNVTKILIEGIDPTLTSNIANTKTKIIESIINSIKRYLPGLFDRVKTEIQIILKSQQLSMFYLKKSIMYDNLIM